MAHDESQKIVVLTGGSRGIGRAIAEVLAADYTVINLDREVPSCRDDRVTTMVLDVSDESRVKHAFEAIRTEHGVPHALVNNAGISEPLEFRELSLQSWNRQIKVNLTAPFLTSREFSRLKSDDRSSARTIINIASASGLVGMPRYAAYNCSKSGLIELTKTLAVELAPSIHTCAICPGYILTPMQQAEYSAEELASCADANPSRRLGTPDEVAALVSFILSGKNNYLNGSVLVMDGGETSGGMAS